MSTYANGYKYRRTVSVDYTKVNGGADLTDFAVYFKTTNADLKSVANSGKVQLPIDSNGDPLLDVRFELTNGTKLDHEIAEYNPATGLLTVWIRIPTLSYTVNTDFYMFYGKAITVAEDNQTGVWHSSYRAVWHGSHENPYIYNGNTQARGITKLGDVNYGVDAIQYGYRSGDLTWILNWFEGSANNGEIQIQGTTFTDHNGNVRTFSSTLPNKSVAVYDGVAGDYYLVYSLQDVHTRFGTNDSTGIHPNGHPNFFIATYASGTWRQVANGTGSQQVFTPVSSDVIVGQLGITTPPTLAADRERRFETGYMPDSTAYVEHMTAANTQWLNGENAGKLYEYGRTYAGADYSRAGSPTFGVGSGSEASVSMWVKTADTDAALFSYEHSTQGNALLVYLSGGNIGFYRGPNIGSVASATITNNAWHYLTLRWRQSSGGFDIYMDGAMIGSGGGLTGALPTNGFVMLGQEQDSEGGGLSSTQALAGQLEEVRFSDDIDFTTGARHITEYANQNSPSTFYSIGSEVVLPNLAPADATHSHSLEASNPIENKTLALQDVAHGHTLDAITLTQQHNLTVADLVHAHSLDALGTFAQDSLLVTADLAHAQILDETTILLGGTPIPDDMLHSQLLDSITLVQKHYLTVDDLAHTNTLDAAPITQKHQLVADSLEHTHELDAINLIQQHLLAISDALHTQTVDDVVLFQSHVLELQDAFHAHSLEQPFVYTQIDLVVESMLQGHSLDNITILIKVKPKPTGAVMDGVKPSIRVHITKPTAGINTRPGQGGIISTKPSAKLDGVKPLNVKVKP